MLRKGVSVSGYFRFRSIKSRHADDDARFIINNKWGVIAVALQGEEESTKSSSHVDVIEKVMMVELTKVNCGCFLMEARQRGWVLQLM